MTILAHARGFERQDPCWFSIVGGQPLLPRDCPLPLAPGTTDPMTFFFCIDLAFTGDHGDECLSVFASTTTFDENDCIPEMFAPNMRGYNVPAGALTTYQRQFRLVISRKSDCVLRSEYRERVAYNVLRDNDALPPNAVRFGERSDTPRWITGDETPGTYGGRHPFRFLFQTELDYRYWLVAGAPRQMVPDYSSGANGLTPRVLDRYDLWAANAAFFFVTADRSVLVSVQSD